MNEVTRPFPNMFHPRDSAQAAQLRAPEAWLRFSRAVASAAPIGKRLRVERVVAVAAGPEPAAAVAVVRIHAQACGRGPRGSHAEPGAPPGHAMGLRQCRRRWGPARACACAMIAGPSALPGPMWDESEAEWLGGRHGTLPAGRREGCGGRLKTRACGRKSPCTYRIAVPLRVLMLRRGPVLVGKGRG